MSFTADDFAHPDDKAALKALQSIPLFTPCLKAFMKVFSEEYFHGTNLAQKIRLGPNQLPKIYNLLPPICARLGIAIPEFYLEMDPQPNAYTFGDSKIFITVTSGLVDCCSEAELRAAVAHECGHILCHHVLYHTMATMVASGAKVFGALSAMALPVELGLLHWDRMSEFTADRAAAIATGSADPLVHIMIRLAGGPQSITRDVNIAAYAEQGAEYEKLKEHLWDRILQGWAVLSQSHPFTAVRTHEILKWCEQGDYATLAGRA